MLRYSTIPELIFKELDNVHWQAHVKKKKKAKQNSMSTDQNKQQDMDAERSYQVY